MAIAYLALGSNLGDRVAQLNRAKDLVSSFGIKVERCSPIYESEPFFYNPEDKVQPWFLNRVCEVSTDHTSTALYLLCKEVESCMGKSTSSFMQNGQRRYLPRTIDVDLLLYEDELYDSSVFQLPHPRFHDRVYDLKPLADLAPELHHPRLGKTVGQLLALCEDPREVRLFRGY